MKPNVVALFLFITLTSIYSYYSNAESVTAVETVHLRLACNVRVVSEIPHGPHVGDILFLTGFADRADNHKPLFSKLASAGYRVISFDYPMHGGTQCLDLDLHNFTSISNMAADILNLPRYKSDKPLYLSGWSTGGLMIYRMAQRGYFQNRKVSGLVLLAPGFSVYSIPGESGAVTERSLLSNPHPPHKGPIRPNSPLLYLGFSASLLRNSFEARSQAIPNVPVLMILADDKDDVYADSKTIKEWYRKKRTGTFYAVQCAHAKHELDNEIEPIGSSVRQLFYNFVSGINTRLLASDPCHIVR